MVGKSRGLAAATIALLTSCGGPGTEGSADATSIDASGAVDALDAGGPAEVDAFDPFCHYDCFFSITCVDGVVWEQVHAPVPCASWTGSCPRIERGRCTMGCSDRLPAPSPNPRSADWTQWCEESEVRRPGDPCEVDADCEPPDGWGVYLGCDLESGTCVTVDPPVAPTAACEASFEGLFSPSMGSAYGVVRDPSCASGLCRFSARGSTEDCDRHVCGLACEHGWDCPPTYRCEAMPDWTGRRVGEGPVGAVMVCVGGGEELVCH